MWFTVFWKSKINLLQMIHLKQPQPQPQQQKKLKQLNNLLRKMKTLATVTVGMLLFAASGCTSTLTVGPQANTDASVLACGPTVSVLVHPDAAKSSIPTVTVASVFIFLNKLFSCFSFFCCCGCGCGCLR